MSMRALNADSDNGFRNTVLKNVMWQKRTLGKMSFEEKAQFESKSRES